MKDIKLEDQKSAKCINREQFSLATLLAVITCLALLFGWCIDRLRLERRITEIREELEMQRRQINAFMVMRDLDQVPIDFILKKNEMLEEKIDALEAKHNTLNTRTDN